MNLIFLKGSSIVVTSCSEQVPLSQEGASSPCFYTMIRWIVILQKLPKLHWSPKIRMKLQLLFGPILPLATWDVPALPGWTVDASDVWTTTWSPLASFSMPPCSKFQMFSYEALVHTSNLISQVQTLQTFFEGSPKSKLQTWSMRSVFCFVVIIRYQLVHVNKNIKGPLLP